MAKSKSAYSVPGKLGKIESHSSSSIVEPLSIVLVGHQARKARKVPESFSEAKAGAAPLCTTTQQQQPQRETAKIFFSQQNLKEEVGDVYTMIDLLVEWDVLSWDEIEARRNKKREKLKRWSDLI